MKQRHLNLNPDPGRLEVFKINYTSARYHTYRWTLEAMRFIPHDGTANYPQSCYLCSHIVPEEHVNNGAHYER